MYTALVMFDYYCSREILIGNIYFANVIYQVWFSIILVSCTLLVNASFVDIVVGGSAPVS